MSVEDEVLSHAAELMRNAPGVVSVRRISQIEQVRLLREATATLTEGEQSQLRDLRLALMERLDGAVSTKRPVKQQKTSFMGSLVAALQRGSTAMRTQGQNLPPKERDAPTRLPAPKELLDAAEAWVIAHWTADRLDADTSVLCAPWEAARIEPVDGEG